MNLAGAKVVITADQGIRGGKVIELKKTVVDAVSRCPLVTTILTAKRTGKPVVSSPFDVDLDEVTFFHSLFHCNKTPKKESLRIAKESQKIPHESNN